MLESHGNSCTVWSGWDFYMRVFAKLHSLSVNFVRHFSVRKCCQHFCTLKNKYDLTLCQSRLNTASEIFVRHKNIRIGFDFLNFSHPWQAFWKVFCQFRATVQANSKINQVHPLHLAAKNTVYRSLHTEFTEIGGLLLKCGSSIASKPSNWATDILK